MKRVLCLTVTLLLGCSLWQKEQWLQKAILMDEQMIGIAPQMVGYWLGTDMFGRDMLARVVSGLNSSIIFVTTVTLVSVAMGVGMGIIAGYYGGRAKAVILSIVDLLTALPFFLSCLVCSAIIGSEWWGLIALLCWFEWGEVARVIAAETAKIMRSGYLQSAKSLGQSPMRCLQKHILPHLHESITFMIIVTARKTLVVESTLSFLGLGVQEPYTTLGGLLSQGALLIDSHWWMMVGPLLVMLLMLFSLDTAMNDKRYPQYT